MSRRRGSEIREKLYEILRFHIIYIARIDSQGIPGQQLPLYFNSSGYSKKVGQKSFQLNVNLEKEKISLIETTSARNQPSSIVTFESTSISIVCGNVEVELQNKLGHKIKISISYNM